MATFTLTTGLDTFVGGPGDNTVDGTAATLNPGDSLTGGTGNNVLALYGSGTFRVDQLATFSGFSNITLNNYTNGTATLYLGSQPISVTGLGSGQEILYLGGGQTTYNGGSGSNIIYISGISDWNPADVINGGNSGYLNFYTNDGPNPTTYDLTASTVQDINQLYGGGDNLTLKINSADAGGILNFNGGGANDQLVTSDATLDLSHTEVSNFSVLSTNTTGTTFTVKDVTTAFTIAGGPGQDTIVANGFAFTADQRNAIFATASIEKIVDTSGTYTAPSPIPAVTAVAETPSTGDLNGGKSVTITLTTSDAVTVTGTPTITLNDGGTAIYDAVKSTATSPVFDYTVGSSGTDVSSLQVTALNLPGGATIQDDGGNNLNLSLSSVPTYSGPQIDTTIPAAPAAPADSAVVNGYVNAVHDTAAQALIGNAEDGSTVTVYDNNTQVGTTSADASTGAWSFPIGVLADGSTHSYTVTATDTAGNVSQPSAALSLTVDTTAPATPAAPSDSAVVNGYVNAAHDTAAQALTGSAEKGSTVTVYDNSTQVGTTSADASTGAWSLPIGVLADGSTHSYTVTATDADGNVSQPSAALNFTVDITPPATPAAPADVMVVNGYVNAARDTQAQALTGNAEDGSTVTVYNNGTQIGTTTANASTGHWGFLIGQLADGSTHSYTITATDAVGNVSQQSSALSFTVDIVPPAKPTTPADNAVVNGYVDAAHDTAAQALTGSAEDGSTVIVYDNGTKVGITTASTSTGAWSYPIGVLADGSAHSYTVSATDAAGNVSQPSAAFNFRVDITPPATPAAAADSAVVNGYVDAAHDTAAQALTGSAERGSTLTVYDNNTQIGTTIANASTGHWGFLIGQLADGSTHSYTVTATDAAGNVSQPSAPLNFVVATGMPPDAFLGNDTSDVLFRNTASGDIWFEAMSNGAPSAPNPWQQIGGSDTHYSLVGVGDFYGTGTSDILFRNNSTGDTWIEAISNGAVAGWNEIGGSDTYYSLAGVGDFYGTGTEDILFRDTATGDTWFEAISNGAFAGWNRIGGSDTHFAVVGLGDFLGTGTDDILFRNNATGDTWLEAISSGAFSGWSEVEGSDTHYSVVGVGDFFGNGTNDILFRNNSTGDTWFEAVSNGASAGWHEIGGSNTAYSVVGIGDYFGTDTSDILFRNASTGDTWLEAISSGSFAWLESHRRLQHVLQRARHDRAARVDLARS